MSERPILIGIAGGSGSGKTHLARQICADVGPESASLLSMDQYFRTERNGDPSSVNFDHPAHLDLDLMVSHLEQLKAGRDVITPAYDFGTMLQTPNASKVEARCVVLVEGLFVLASPLVEIFDLTCFLDVDDDQRLLGRILRDIDERHASMHAIIDRYQRFVRPSYHVFVAPTRQNADIVVDFTYRRNFFTRLLVGLIQDCVRPEFDLTAFVAGIRNETYRLGYKAHQAFMPVAIDIKQLAKAYPEYAIPESLPHVPSEQPQLYLSARPTKRSPD